MRRPLRPAYRFVLLSSLATAITAFGQVPGTEAVLLQGQTLAPVANTWSVNDDGQVVLNVPIAQPELAGTKIAEGSFAVPSSACRSLSTLLNAFSGLGVAVSRWG